MNTWGTLRAFCNAIRLLANQVLQAKIRHLLTRPVGAAHPDNPSFGLPISNIKPLSWDRPRRVIAKVEWHRDELFPRVAFHPDQTGAHEPKGWYNTFTTVEARPIAVDQGRQVCP